MPCLLSTPAPTHQEARVAGVGIHSGLWREARSSGAAFVKARLLCRLGSAKRRNLRDQLVGVVANALYYNPLLTLQSLQQQQQLSSFMNAWFQVGLTGDIRV